MKNFISLITLISMLAAQPVWAVGKIQNEDVKSLSDLTAAGGSVSQLINSTKIYDTTNAQQLSTSIANGQLGGSGGAKNYLSSYTASTSGGTVNSGNGNFEKNATTGFGLMSTTISSAIPTSTPSSTAASITTFATTGTNPLSGKYSLQVASTGAITQGQGFISTPFYIDSSDQGKVLTVSGTYIVQSGAANLNFSGTSSNTYAVYIYDTTSSTSLGTAQWIQPAGVYNFTQNSGAGKFSATFQTNTTSTQYQVAIIAVNASAGASSVLFDDLSVSPQISPSAPAVSDPQIYVPTFVGFNTSSGTFYYWRVGKFLHIQGVGLYSSGSAPVTMSLPPGLVADTNYIVSSSTGIGSAYTENSSTGYSLLPSVLSGGTTIRFDSTFGTGGTVGRLDTSANRPFTYSAGAALGVDLLIPISGWSSNSVASSDTATQVITSTVGLTNNQTIAANGQIIYDTVVSDKSGMYSISTGKMTVPASGSYSVQVIAESSAAPAIYLQVNGVNKNYIVSCSVIAKICSGSVILPLNAGDQIAIFGDQSGTMSGSSVFQNMLSVQRISGPAVITATESVYARYTASGSTQSITGNTPTTIIAGTKVSDTHNAYNSSTGFYTCPVSGQYEVNANIILTSTSQSINTAGAGLDLFKNGVVYSVMGIQRVQASGSFSPAVGGESKVFCNAGDTLDVRGAITTTNTLDGSSGGTAGTWVEFKRIGN